MASMSLSTSSARVALSRHTAFTGNRVVSRARSVRARPARATSGLVTRAWKLTADEDWCNANPKVCQMLPPIDFSEVTSCKVGADATRGVDVVVDIDTVSGCHAELEAVGDDLWLSDLGSTNGTFVNMLAIKEKVKLNAGDKVSFGGDMLYVVA